MIGIFVALIVALGVGGTAVVSDSARPGDTLFGIDQTVENVRISLASKENKNELRIRFAEERIKEVDELKEEDEKINDDTESLTDEQEAEVNLGIEAALELLTDLDEEGDTDDARLQSLAEQLSLYLDNLPADARVQLNDGRLRIKFEGGPEQIKIQEQGENKLKIETQSEEGHLKIEVKNGSIEIKAKAEDEDDSSEGTGKDTDEIEAKILSDKTIVKVEIGDEETTFATSATTREGIIAAIIAKFPNLTSAQVEAVLKIETENGDDDEDSEEDLDDDSDDDSDDDNDDEDEDSSDDEDEDNSGSGSKND